MCAQRGRCSGNSELGAPYSRSVAAAVPGGWSSRPLSALTPIAARQQVQVWHSGRAEVLHAVRLDSAQLTGIPYFKSVACDSCRVVIPRAQIDSVRVGDMTDGFWRTTALALGVVFVAGIVHCLKRDCGGT